MIIKRIVKVFRSIRYIIYMFFISIYETELSIKEIQLYVLEYLSQFVIKSNDIAYRLVYMWYKFIVKKYETKHFIIYQKSFLLLYFGLISYLFIYLGNILSASAFYIIALIFIGLAILALVSNIRSIIEYYKEIKRIKKEIKRIKKEIEESETD